MTEFVACTSCVTKPGSPALCTACLHNRDTIQKLQRENAALTDVYVIAARLRTHPVPFDDHFALVGAVDECRAVLEPPVDNYAPPPAPSTGAWQACVDAYPRNEFFAAFREAHAALHRLWTESVGKPDYNKALWRLIDNALARFARDAAEKAGISRSEPLL